MPSQLMPDSFCLLPLANWGAYKVASPAHNTTVHAPATALHIYHATMILENEI